MQIRTTQSVLAIERYKKHLGDDVPVIEAAELTMYIKQAVIAMQLLPRCLFKDSAL